MVYFLFYLGTKNIMLNLPFLFPFYFLFLSFSFLLIIFGNFLCYFFATENSKQPKITYLQHVYFTFIFFPFDVSFCFFSCFLFSFSFFSLVISALRAFLFSPALSLFLLAFSIPCPLNLTLHHRDAYRFRPVSFDLAALLPSSGTCPRSKVQRDKIGIFLPHPGPLL